MHSHSIGRRARQAVLLGLALVAGLAHWSVPRGAQAQDFPTRRLTVIVPYAPGGQGDFLARLINQRLADRIGQPVVIENRPSVTGLVGVVAGARATPDGYTITLIANQNLVSNLIEQGPFNLARDVAPVIKLADYYLLLLVRPSLAVRNVDELLAMMKAKPRGLTLGSGGVGASGHVAMELVKQKTGAEALHVPYKGEGPAITALLAGEVDMAFITVSGSAAHVKAGKMRAIGVSSAKRLAAWPDVQAVAESVPGVEYVSWFGMVAPPATPRPRIDYLAREIGAILQVPEVRQTLADRAFEVAGGTPDQFGRNIQNDAEVLGKLIRELGIKPQ